MIKIHQALSPRLQARETRAARRAPRRMMGYARPPAAARSQGRHHCQGNIEAALGRNLIARIRSIGCFWCAPHAQFPKMTHSCWVATCQLSDYDRATERPRTPIKQRVEEYRDVKTRDHPLQGCNRDCRCRRSRCGPRLCSRRSCAAMTGLTTTLPPHYAAYKRRSHHCVDCDHAVGSPATATPTNTPSGY